jgi:hypothetical protein
VTSPPAPALDLPALAAQLRLGVMAWAAEWLALLGAGRMATALWRQIGAELTRMEAFAAGIVALTALRTMPLPPERPPGGRRPAGAPPGFARVAVGCGEIRAMKRFLFPQLRDVRARLARFDAVLDDVAAHAARLAPRIACPPPLTRLIAIAPPARVLAPCVVSAAASVRADTS